MADTNPWSEIIIALVSAVTGGSLLKVFDTWLNRAKLKNDKAKQSRDEAYRESESLRSQIKDLKEEMKTIETTADDWRAQYWDARTRYEIFKIKVAQLLLENGVSPSDLFKE